MRLKISVSPSAALLAAAGWLDTAGLLPPLLLAAAAHESGHLFALRARGIPVRRIRLTCLGAELECGQGSYLDDAAAAAAGPAASFALAVLAACAGRLAHDRWLYLLAGVSAALGAFNLLPALPLDGGRLLFALTAQLFSRDAACAAVRTAGLAAAAAVLAAGLWAAWETGGKLALPAAGAFLIIYIVKGERMV